MKKWRVLFLFLVLVLVLGVLPAAAAPAPDSGGTGGWVVPLGAPVYEWGGCDGTYVVARSSTNPGFWTMASECEEGDPKYDDPVVLSVTAWLPGCPDKLQMWDTVPTWAGERMQATLWSPDDKILNSTVAYTGDGNNNLRTLYFPPSVCDPGTYLMFMQFNPVDGYTVYSDWHWRLVHDDVGQ